MRIELLCTEHCDQAEPTRELIAAKLRVLFWAPALGKKVI